MSVRLTYRDGWFEYMECILNTMIKNMNDDLACGYNYFGACITKQKNDIDEFQAKFNNQMNEFKSMDEMQVNRWCFYDLKRRGVIA